MLEISLVLNTNPSPKIIEKFSSLSIIRHNSRDEILKISIFYIVNYLKKGKNNFNRLEKMKLLLLIYLIGFSSMVFCDEADLTEHAEEHEHEHTEKVVYVTPKKYLISSSNLFFFRIFSNS